MLLPIDRRFRLAQLHLLGVLVDHPGRRVGRERDPELCAVLGYDADRVISRDEPERAGCLFEHYAGYRYEWRTRRMEPVRSALRILDWIPSAPSPTGSVGDRADEDEEAMVLRSDGSGGSARSELR